MRLKKTYAKKSEIPAGAEALYAEKNGVWTRRDDLELEVDEPDEIDSGRRRKNDGDDDDGNDRLKEFRETNRTLTKQNRDLNAELGRLRKTLEGIDPEQLQHYQQAMSKQRDEEDRKLLAEGKIDEVVQRKVRRQLEERDTEIKQRTKAYEELQGKYTKVSQTLAQAAAQKRFNAILNGKGLRPRQHAEDDLTRAILADWGADEHGKLVLLNQDLIGRDGGPITPEEYAEKELAQRRNYFFEPAVGGKGRDSSAGGDQKGVKQIKRGDPLAFGHNLKEIANGTAQLEPRRDIEG